ncbi:unnamed protein product [Parascedosporium putredinis]|uniref:Secreted protein n=1 Tax=Parascedosporium putredinis TaxID=1442378 RepID=A0A9P1GZ85_9PEZI|nr:unnamed protein product [Parascedosporium putredinis]CAI7991532.1 unnamed protein product [Parascedosporium putredinis]
MRIVLLLTTLLLALLTLRTANDPATPTPAANVLRTASHSVNAAVILNAACSVAARVTAAVPAAWSPTPAPLEHRRRRRHRPPLHLWHRRLRPRGVGLRPELARQGCRLGRWRSCALARDF